MLRSAQGMIVLQLARPKSEMDSTSTGDAVVSSSVSFVPTRLAIRCCRNKYNRIYLYQFYFCVCCCVCYACKSTYWKFCQYCFKCFMYKFLFKSASSFPCKMYGVGDMFYCLFQITKEITKYEFIDIYRKAYTHFFKINTFISNARPKLAKHQATTKQHHEAEPLLFVNYSLSSSTLSSKNNTGDILKNVQKTNAYILMRLYDKLQWKWGGKCTFRAK